MASVNEYADKVMAEVDIDIRAGLVPATVDAYPGTHRVTYAARHAAAGRLPGLRRPAHADRCECCTGYVCLTHRIPW